MSQDLTIKELKEDAEKGDAFAQYFLTGLEMKARRERITKEIEEAQNHLNRISLPSSSLLKEQVNYHLNEAWDLLNPTKRAGK